MDIICKMCGKNFVPLKNDKRIKYCSVECRLDYRKFINYDSEYYKNNKIKWEEKQSTEEYKKIKNKRRRYKYATDKKYRDYVNKKVKEYRDNDPLHKLKKRLRPHKMTIKEYNKLLKKQNNRCAICGSEQNNTKLTDVFYIDHCHETNRVRGLLCNKCNFGIGQFNDNIELLKKAIKYLEDN